MTGSFDPLHKWLGIPPERQPPNVYQLLGIQTLENDPDVISNAADQRMAHLRTQAQGAHAGYAENLLNQMAAARLCLLNPQTKEKYDRALGSSPNGKAPVAAKTSQIAQTATSGNQGDLFGAYVMMERIGGGRSGPIFRAKNRQTGQIVSLKILPSNAAESPQLMKRFEREVKLSSCLSHPNLVGAYGAGEQDGVHFLVLEHLDGSDLATLVQRGGRMAVDRAVNFTIQTARGLGHLHANGVFHRNVKPHNLIVDKQDVVKIANLTVARLADTADLADTNQEGLTQTGEMLGSVDYLAPEQASDAHAVDARSDIYSLGCTLYYLLAGAPPYKGKSLMDKLMAHRSQPIPSLQVVRPDVPPALDKVVTKMLAKDPAGRYSSMDEVVAALEGRSASKKKWWKFW